MKRIITIATLLVLVFSTSFAQPMKWKKLADGILDVCDDFGPPEFSAIETKGNTILAAWSNVVLSTDGGTSWTTLSVPGLTTFIIDVAMYDENTFVLAGKDGLFFSYDRGNTWSHQKKGTFIYSVFFDNSPDDLIYLDENASITVLHLGSEIAKTPFPVALTGLQRGADNAYYTMGGIPGGSNFMFRSADHGMTWQQIALVNPSDADCFTFICDKNDPRRFVVVNEDWAYRTDEQSQIFLTTDAGISWATTLSKPLGNYTYLLGNSSQGCNDYFVGTVLDGVLRSSDKGVSWQSIGGPRSPVDSRSLFAVDDSTIYAIDDLGSIWMTDAGKQNGSRLAISTSTSVNTDTIGGDIVIPISITHSDSTVGGCMLHFDERYLIYHGAFDPSGTDHTITTSSSTARIAYDPSVDSVMYAKFSFFPIDSNCTTVTIDSITPKISKSDCNNISTSFISVSVCVPDSCGYGELARFIRYGTIPEFSITPNPSRGTITLRSNVDIDGATIEIRNEVGAISYSTHSDLRNVDGVSLDVSSLPSGAYILLVKGHGAGVPLVIMK